eukprot:gnl/Trimastix_PCT/234.p1 GENE.gnl/Trimastix_PCT/234~~gnl/Trimastix_PCT/234.p1  ORF type:complete len:1093 (+),score=551.24 gnl/Trimastix_PCT/234:33-3281(+)
MAREVSASGWEVMEKSWERQQKKAFTGWVNTHLSKRGLRVEDVEQDFKDGLNLVALVEIISGETITHNKRPRMKYHQMENLNFALAEIGKALRVTCSADNLYNGDLKMILGLLWTLILRYQIQEISVEQMNAKEGLLLWCQRKTQGYAGVNVVNFSTSFQDGLAFAALVHRHRPSLINFEELDRVNKAGNLQRCFDVIEEHLGVAPMLDAEEMVEVKPDEFAVMTYVSQLFHIFASDQKGEVAARRVAKIVDFMRSTGDLRTQYIESATELKQGIEVVLEMLQAPIGSNLEDVEARQQEFDGYRTEGKPLIIQQLSVLEGTFNSLNMKLRGANRPAFVEPEGLAQADFTAMWHRAEELESERTAQLRTEMRKQRQLARMHARFDRKANALQQWCAASTEAQQQEDAVDSVAAALTYLKMHESFEEELQLNCSTRLNELQDMAGSMIDQGHQPDVIEARMNELTGMLDALSQLATQRKDTLTAAKDQQEEMERLRKDFAEQANEYMRWAMHAKEVLADCSFPDTLDALVAFKEQLDAQADECTSAGEASLARLQEAHEKLASAGVEHNQYTAITMGDIQAQLQNVRDAAAKRLEAYEEALQKQRNLEERRVKFAEMAAAFVAQLEAEQYEDLEGTLEEKKAEVVARSEASKLPAMLEEAVEFERESRDLGITENKHTEYTAAILRGKMEQRKNMIAVLLTYLDEQIGVRDRGLESEKEFQQREHSNNLCIEFAQKALEINIYLENLREACAEPEVESLQEAQDIAGQIEAMDARHAEVRTAFDALKELAGTMTEAGIEENTFTNLDVPALEEKFTEADAQMKTYAEQVAETVTRETRRQEVCTEFATKADELVAFAQAKKELLKVEGADKEAEVARIRELLGEVEACRESVYAEVLRLGKQIAEESHDATPFTDHDTASLALAFDQLADIGKRTLQHLEEQILAAKMGDVTPEELAELRHAFDHFDTNKNGMLSKHEIKACLNALDQDISDEALDRLADEEGLVSFDAFTGFMKSCTKDTDTADQILDSFKQLAGDKEFLTADDLAAVMEPADVEYLLAMMPAHEGGEPGQFDYATYVQSVFA